MSVQAVISPRISRNRKFSDEALLELHCQGLSIPKLAKQLGVSQQPVRSRMRKLGLMSNHERGGVPSYEKVGASRFRCAGCRKVKPLRQRSGRKCKNCTQKRYLSTTNGALRHRFDNKKCQARRKSIPFHLIFEEYKAQYEKQGGKDGYTGEQIGL